MYISIIAGIVLFILLIIAYIIYENKQLSITQYDIISKHIPIDFHKTKFLLLSDLHNNEYGKNNVKLIAKINKINPDYILIAGDMVVGKEGHETKIALELLREIAKKYPIYYSNGNHEQRLGIYETTKETVYTPYVNQLDQLGIHFLKNEHCFVRKGNSKIVITGLEIHEDFFKKIKRSTLTPEYLNQIIGTPNNDEYQILIAHNPMFFEDYIKWGADLVVSGHVHGGMVRLPFIGGIISPQYQLFPKYDAGMFEKNGKYMILSRGLGMHTIKIRFLNKPELAVINLTHESLDKSDNS